jgi:hypothetical protein
VTLRAQAQYAIPTWTAPGFQKFVGGRYKLRIPKRVIVNRGQDADYEDYGLGFVSQKKTFWLSGIFGPNATSGKVREDWLASSVEVTQRTWKRGEFEGVDAKGRLRNGNYWRYFGQPGESIKYYDVSGEAAAFFDRILDGVCFRDWR